MVTRYSRRTADDKAEYYDSREEMQAAEYEESREGTAGIFGFIGLFVGGTLVYLGLNEFGYGEWPKVARFSAIIGGGLVGAAVCARLAELISALIFGVLGLAILYGLGVFLWGLV